MASGRRKALGSQNNSGPPSPTYATAPTRKSLPEPLTELNVFFYIPNLVGKVLSQSARITKFDNVGYTRILLAACSLYYMRWHPKYCTWLYVVSCLLDAVDGMAARYFHQSLVPASCCPFLMIFSVEIRRSLRHGD